MEHKQAEIMAKALMVLHGLDSWTFSLDNAKLRAGLCNHNTKCIQLSKHYVELNDETLISNTILHEIAHAIVGRGNGHNNKWKFVAKKIGCTGERCNSKAILSKGRYELVCPNCNIKTYQYRKTKLRRACAVCCNKYNNGKFSEKYEFMKEINR